jgi:hypothetical protein
LLGLRAMRLALIGKAAALVMDALAMALGLRERHAPATFRSNLYRQLDGNDNNRCCRARPAWAGGNTLLTCSSLASRRSGLGGAAIPLEKKQLRRGWPTEGASHWVRRRSHLDQQSPMLGEQPLAGSASVATKAGEIQAHAPNLNDSGFPLDLLPRDLRRPAMPAPCSSRCTRP